MINILRSKAPKEVLSDMYENILLQALLINKTKTGTLHIINNSEHSLELVFYTGLTKEFADHFKIVTPEDGSICGRALKTGRSVFIPDLSRDESFAPHMKYVIESGIRSVQSTPLISRKENVIGVLSTHYKLPRNLST